MEYFLPEATIGVKWEYVWNGIIFSNAKFIRILCNNLLVKFGIL